VDTCVPSRGILRTEPPMGGKILGMSYLEVGLIKSHCLTLDGNHKGRFFLESIK